MDQTGGTGPSDPLMQQPAVVMAAVGSFSGDAKMSQSVQFTFHCNFAKRAPRQHWAVSAESSAPGTVCAVLCAGGTSFGRRIKEWEPGSEALTPHQMFATWPLRLQADQLCAFGTVLISALSVTPVPPQVCAYAKQGARRVLGTPMGEVSWSPVGLQLLCRALLSSAPTGELAWQGCSCLQQ